MLDPLLVELLVRREMEAKLFAVADRAGGTAAAAFRTGYTCGRAAALSDDQLLAGHGAEPGRNIGKAVPATTTEARPRQSTRVVELRVEVRLMLAGFARFFETAVGLSGVALMEVFVPATARRAADALAEVAAPELMEVDPTGADGTFDACAAVWSPRLSAACR